MARGSPQNSALENRGHPTFSRLLRKGQAGADRAPLSESKAVTPRNSDFPASDDIHSPLVTFDLAPHN